MARAYQPKRHTLRPQASVDEAQLLAAREDICNVVKTSSGCNREKTACAVNKVREERERETPDMDCQKRVFYCPQVFK